jgi:hypothetical protein
VVVVDAYFRYDSGITVLVDSSWFEDHRVRVAIRSECVRVCDRAAVGSQRQRFLTPADAGCWFKVSTSGLNPRSSALISG